MGGLRIVGAERMPRLAAFVLLAGWVLVAAALGGCGADELRQQTITLGGHELTVWVARTEAQHVEGLQSVPPIQDGEGMLFVWDEPAQRTFSLKDVEYEIDVVFVGEDGRVLDVDTIGPGGQLVAESAQAVGWVVEVPGGWAQAHDVAEGSALHVEGGL